MLEELNDYSWRQVFAFAGEEDTLLVKDESDSYSYHNAKNLSSVIGSTAHTDSFSRNDVKSILGIWDGENDEDSWHIYGELNDGRFFYIEAWCDYTGFD